MDKPWFFARLSVLIQEHAPADEHWSVDHLGPDVALVRCDDSDPDYGGGDCEWFTVVLFENYVPTVVGLDCNWRNELELLVAKAEREERAHTAAIAARVSTTAAT